MLNVESQIEFESESHFPCPLFYETTTSSLSYSMSRYIEDEIKNLSKPVLVEYVQRQPEISFPTKICSRPVGDMNKKHLIRALAGNYGYIRAPAVSSAVTEASPCPSDSAAEASPCPSVSAAEDPIDLDQPEGIYHNSHGFLSPVSGQQDDYEDEPEGIRHDSHRSLLSPVSARQQDRDMQLDELEHNADQIEPVEATQFGPSSPLFSPVVLESVDETASVVSASPALYSSSPREAAQPHHEGHLITWYGVDEESDEDLLDAFFCQNPGLAEQVTRMKTHRRKRQTDASLVRDYKFSLEVYKLLMERQWENESGHILSESIMKYIGLSAPWFTKARKVTGLLEKIGPGSPNPDPLVLQRLLSGATIGKGKDILAFLNIQANAAAAGNQ